MCYIRLFLGGLQPLCGIGVISRTKLNRIPLLRIALNAASLPSPGPFIITFARRIPWSTTVRIASLAAVWAANAVPRLGPLNPQVPAEDHEITRPCPSVMDTIVLRKPAWIWIIPFGTLRAFLRDLIRPFRRDYTKNWSSQSMGNSLKHSERKIR